MNMNNYRIVYPNELNHYGVRGMKWGVRKQVPLIGRRHGGTQKPQMNDAQRKAQRRARAKKAAIVGGSIVAASLAAYGAYKITKIRKSNTQAVQKYLDTFGSGGTVYSRDKWGNATSNSRSTTIKKTLFGPQLQVSNTSHTYDKASQRLKDYNQYTEIIGARRRKR